ncbi:hypothetical protein [Candidatus Enterococcus mansonii]|uniref:Type VII secretion protein EssA n=1 Tax=Candidatus Enterococcus mansonii TaxID=1834181 RepID=A0A242CF77_9ENTE|nr:hypothetical protein [Enterococcus sp. 4G2_DIV0659]OTO08432.1 hypothetical protein A5880_001432 [Enterococcus sp. 4G2_DIV0659]
MQRKLKVKPNVNTMLKGMLIPMLFLFLQSVPTYAESGDLKINNQVIYEKNEGSQSNSATFTIHQLFMQDMSAQDKKLDEEKMQVLAAAQKEVFMKETPKVQTISQQITPLLFSNGYVLNDSLDNGESGLKKGNNIGFLLFCTVGGVLVIGLGILLGRAFPTWVKKG